MSIKAVQTLGPTKQPNKDNKVVSIGAHGAATKALGPYFVQITTGWDAGSPQIKWTTISLTVEDAMKLHNQLHEAITKRKGVTNGTATFHEMVSSLGAQ